MKKKLMAVLLALTLAVSLLPMPAAAVTEKEFKQIRESTETAVTNYTSKFSRSGSDEDALADFLYHGFFGRGRSMIVKDSDPIVSTMFSSLMMREALVNGIAYGIKTMADMGSEVILLSGICSWHSYYDNYYFKGCLSENADPDQYISWVISAWDLYGEERYTGPKNKYDDAMYLIAGAMPTEILIKRKEIKDNKAIYDVKLSVKDCFDFDTGYDGLKEAGYDTSQDEKLIKMGKLLNVMGLDDFNWSYATGFQLEVPYFEETHYCDHESKNYHWTYDSANRSLRSETDDTFSANYAKQRNCLSDSERDFFQLDESITLKHDQPWVMEQKMYGMEIVVINPKSSTDHSQKYIYTQRKGDNKLPQLFIAQVEYEYLSEVSEYWTEKIRHYASSQKECNMDFRNDHVYVVTLENRIDKNGKNMVWGGIYDETDGVYMLPIGPLDNYYYKAADGGGYTNGDRKTDMLNGADLYLSYIGDRNNPMPKRFIELKVWEKGKETTDVSWFVAENVHADCTRPAETVYTCSECGFNYNKETSPALGHSYGDFTDDGNTTCTADGTKTRSCTVCGETETVTVEGSAAGHSFTDYTDDGNRSCTDVGTKTRRCTVCGEVETVPNEGTASGHDFGLYSFDHNSTCTADGTKTAVCKTCGEKDTVPAEGSATGHLYEAAVTAPTCTAEGYTTYTCRCGDSYVGDRTAVAEHTWDKGTVTVRPTLTAPGTIVYACTLCGKTQHMSVEQLPASAFTDVPADAYYANAVAWAVAQGITSGLSDTLFGPDVSCTRGQVVTFLWAATGKPEPESLNNTFTDVSESDYFYKPVLWAVENGITGGVADGMFGPEQTCTRGQIVTFLWAAQGKPAVSGSSTFSDVADTDWYAKPVIWAGENNVTGGIGDGMFGPNNTCTRGQVVTFLYKVYG